MAAPVAYRLLPRDASSASQLVDRINPILEDVDTRLKGADELTAEVQQIALQVKEDAARLPDAVAFSAALGRAEQLATQVDQAVEESRRALGEVEREAREAKAAAETVGGAVDGAVTALIGDAPAGRRTLNDLNTVLDSIGGTAATAATAVNFLAGALNYVDTIEGLLASLAAGEPVTHIVPGTTFALGSDVPFLQLDCQKLVSENPAYIPIFRDTLGTRGPSDRMVDIWFRNGELRGNWFGQGMAPTAENWENLEDRATYRSGVLFRAMARQRGSAFDDAFGLACDYIGGQYLGTVFEARGHNAKIYKIAIDEIEGHELTGGLWHQYGTSTTFTSTYHTINRARANSKIIRYLPDWLKFGDNAGSGGSPGFEIWWAEIYRGGRGVVTYSNAQPIAGTNGDSTRKLRFRGCSLRGQIGNSIDLGAGTDIEFHSATTDDSNYGALVRENFEGTVKFIDLIAKDARKSGFRNLSPTARVVLVRPQVGNNSFNFRSAFVLTPAAVGNGTVNGVSDFFGPDAFINDGDLVGSGTMTAAEGNWTIEFSSPTAYALKRPNGTTAASGTVGATLTAGSELRLRVNAGSTAFVAGDVITLNVSRKNEHRAVYSGIESDFPVTIIGGVSGVSLSWRLQAGWYGWIVNPSGGYRNAKDGDELRPGIATSLNVVFKDVVTDPKSQIKIGSDAFATRANAVAWLSACSDPYISAMAYVAKPEEGGGAPLKIEILAKKWRREWTDWQLNYAPAGSNTGDPNAAPITNRMSRSNSTLSDGTGGSLVDGQSAATQAYGIKAPKESLIIESPNCAGNILGDMLLF